MPTPQFVTSALLQHVVEVQSFYHRSMMSALAISTILVGSVVGLLPDASAPPRDGTRLPNSLPNPWWLIPLPPTTGSQRPIVPIDGAVRQVSLSEGTPVPIPESELENLEILEASAGPLTEREWDAATDGEFGSGTGPLTWPAPDEPVPFEVVEHKPQVVKSVAPQYPDLARRLGIEGVVIVRALVGADGRVKEAVIEKSNAEMLNDAALEAVRRWTFTPGVMKHGPVPVWMTIPFRFRLLAK